jgi:hypothetical protein
MTIPRSRKGKEETWMKSHPIHEKDSFTRVTDGFGTFLCDAI